MNEMNHATMAGNYSPDESRHGLRQTSAMSSRRNSISPGGQPLPDEENEGQFSEGSCMPYHQNLIQLHPLVSAESFSDHPSGIQTPTTHQELGVKGRHESEKIAQSKAAYHSWKLEIGAVALSLCSMAILIVLLFQQNDKPLDDWRFLISFNAMISVLGAIARAPLGFVMGSCLGQAKWNWFRKRDDRLSAFEKFEDASRGPMGSLWLLLWLHVRHWSAFGALMTILLLGFEPFLQTIVYYDGQLDALTQLTPPTIRTSERLAVGSYNIGVVTDGNTVAPGLAIGKGVLSVSIPDVRMTAALINGLSNEEEVLGSMASFSCPSGNCTWMPYSTLAICSACNDVTASLKKTESFNRSESEHLRPAIRGTSLPYYRSYALPYVNLTDYPYLSVGYYHELAHPVNMTAAVVSDPALTVSFKTSDTLIAAVGIIRTPPVYNQTNRWESSPSATECALNFCTKAYTARVDNGELNESEIGAWSNRNPQSYALSNNIEDAGTLGGDEGPSDKSLTGWAESLRYDLQLRISEEEAQQKGLPENTTRVFNISQSSAITASYAVTNQLFFSGGIKWPMPTHGPDGPLYALVAQAFGTAQAQDYNAIFETIARSITKFIRNQSNTTHIGEQQEWVIHIRVQWEYLTLPLLIITGACLILLFTIIETNYRRLDPWKSDVLATFTHSVDAETLRQLRSAEVNGQAGHEAENTIVRLVNSEGGLELQRKKD